MQQFMTNVMRNEGYQVDPQRQQDLKYEVARTLGVPLKPGDNSDLTTGQAGKVGGAIGGSMVREMVRMAQESLSKR
ncbi:alpha/beta hydrolase [Bacillus sp. FJAT-18019]|uniref:Alpha/beta hydrolase n=2 Tax=Paenibacillus solani TaxID=1705565 RepID=A0A0M1N351_9BACL|nr:alpha/beta hydrolase [Bacillus sp. FJAT-18019]KOR76440.1 alpha/beta hydrolase [Paenibacillus solani]